MSTDAADRPVTIYTVADRAGVSIATVSRVLRGTAPTSPVTRRKVLQAVQELDYIPLRAARQELLTMRENEEVGDDAFHQLEEELDWLEMTGHEGE